VNIATPEENLVNQVVSAQIKKGLYGLLRLVLLQASYLINFESNIGNSKPKSALKMKRPGRQVCDLSQRGMLEVTTGKLELLLRLSASLAEAQLLSESQTIIRIIS
jgi:hypothetical protein